MLSFGTKSYFITAKQFDEIKEIVQDLQDIPIFAKDPVCSSPLPNPLAREVERLESINRVLAAENTYLKTRIHNMEEEDKGCKHSFIWLVMECVRKDKRIRELEDEDDETDRDEAESEVEESLEIP